MKLVIEGLKVDAGEGSRGGHVIGHTSSGKPIYQNHKHPSHADFSQKDHENAVVTHEKRRRDLPNIHFKDQNNPTKEEIKSFTKEDNKVYAAIGFHDQASKKGGRFAAAGAQIKEGEAAARGRKRAGF